MTDQGTTGDPEEAIANITKGRDKKEDLKLVMTAHSEWDRFFLPAPMTIALLGELLLVCADRDPSLRDRCPEGGFKYLKYPDSLKACLVQITNNGWNAFNRAHTNMDQIRLHTANVEKHIRNAVRILLGGTAKEIEKMLPLTLSKVSEIADTCKTLACETEQKFIDAMLLSEEALEACVAAKGHCDEKDRETEKIIQSLHEKKMESEKLKEKLEKDCQKMEKELDEAKEKFDSAIKEMPSTFKLAGASIVERLVDTIRGVTICVAAPTSVMLSALLMSGFEIAKKRNQTATDPTENRDLAMAISFIKSLKGLVEELGQNIDGAKINSVIEIQQKLRKEKETLKEFSSDLYFDLDDCIDEALKVCSGFIDYTSRAVDHDDYEDDEQVGKIKKIHDELQNKLQKIEARIKRKHAFSIESTPLGRYSLAGSMYDKGRFKVEMAKQTLDDIKRKYEEKIEEMKTEGERFTHTLDKMRSLDLAKLDFDEIQEILINGIRALAEVREQWGRFCEFFQLISNQIKCCLHSSLRYFVDCFNEGKEVVIQGQMMSNVFKMCIIEQATEANCVAYVVQSISSAYVEISSNYLMDGITSLGKLLPLDTKENLAEMTQKRAQLHEDMENAQKAISAIMEKNKREFDERIAERVNRIETDVEAFLPPLPCERVEEI